MFNLYLPSDLAATVVFCTHASGLPIKVFCPSFKWLFLSRNCFLTLAAFVVKFSGIYKNVSLLFLLMNLLKHVNIIIKV